MPESTGKRGHVMKRSFKSLLGLAIMLSALPAFSATLELNGIDFPEGKTVDLTLSPQPGAPDAKMKAKVTFRNGQAGIVVDYQTMKPAILFGGDVTCYVLWAVTRDGQVSNLGELLTPTAKGTGQFTTRPWTRGRRTPYWPPASSTLARSQSTRPSNTSRQRVCRSGRNMSLTRIIGIR